MRKSLAILALFAALGTPCAVDADLAARAVPGDNCTPYNGYAVGYPLSEGTSKSRIANQSAVLADGWRAFGWIIITRSGSAWFVPYPPFFTGKSDAGTMPELVSLNSPDSIAIRSGLAYLAMQPAWRGVNLSMPSKVLIAPCYAAADASP